MSEAPAARGLAQDRHFVRGDDGWRDGAMWRGACGVGSGIASGCFT